MIVQSPFPICQRALMSSPHVGPVLCVRMSATGEYALSGGQDRTVQLWNPAKEKHIKTYSGAHGREVKDVQMSVEGVDSARTSWQQLDHQHHSYF